MEMSRGLLVLHIIVVFCVTFSSGANQIPRFITAAFPVNVSFSEGSATAAGTTLFTFTAMDPDGVTPVFSYTYDPSNTTEILTITESTTTGSATAVVTLGVGKEFNYESVSTYKIYANAFDGVDYAGQVLLTIEILDVGETPTLIPATTVQNFTITENPIGTVIGHPAFNISDLDNLEIHTWTITGGTGVTYIEIYSTNGTIILKSNYDLETAGTPTSVSVDVKIEDKYGLSVTLTYSVFVTDVNDHVPVFSPTTYSFELNQTSAVGTIVANLSATDGDFSAPNNELTYSLNKSYSMADYFVVNGTEIYLAHTVDLTYGSGPYVFFALVTDGGDPAYTATATLSVTVPTATTTPTTTTLVPPPGYDWFQTTSNVVLLLIACIVAACFLGYLFLLCWRWNTYGACLPAKCPTGQECHRCCECCHDKKDDRLSNLDDDFGPTLVLPPHKKGYEAMTMSTIGSSTK